MSGGIIKPAVDPTDPKVRNPAHAEVQQVGRWRYSIWISHGFTRWSGEWGTYRYGHDRAIKKGQRMLAQYFKIEARRKNVTRIS